MFLFLVFSHILLNLDNDRNIRDNRVIKKVGNGVFKHAWCRVAIVPC